MVLHGGKVRAAEKEPLRGGPFANWGIAHQTPDQQRSFSAQINGCPVRDHHCGRQSLSGHVEGPEGPEVPCHGEGYEA